MSGASDQAGFYDLSDLPLTLSDAVAAIIMIGPMYLLQHRDAKPGIFFPDHWGCFGGALEPPEGRKTALVRELEEELAIHVTTEDLRSFTRFDFDLMFADRGCIFREFFELRLPASAEPDLKLGEGQGFGLFNAEDILMGRLRLTPYDYFALWMHISRGRLTPRG